jgi:hypothetical protein
MVKVYTVNGAAAGSASSLPDWLVRKRAAKNKGKRTIREHVEGAIELIQHFEFPEASIRIKTTRDGHHAIATGTYKPQMRVWDLDQLALKFERHTDIENVDFIVSCYPPAFSLYYTSRTRPFTDPFRRLDKDLTSAGGPHRRAAHSGRLSLSHADTSLRPDTRIPFPQLRCALWRIGQRGIPSKSRTRASPKSPRSRRGVR